MCMVLHGCASAHRAGHLRNMLVLGHSQCCTIWDAQEEEGPGEQLLFKASWEIQAFPEALSMHHETSNSKFVKAILKLTSYSIAWFWNKSREDLNRLWTTHTFAFGWVTSTGVLDLAENSEWHFLGLWQSLCLMFCDISSGMLTINTQYLFIFPSTPESVK